MRFGTRLGLAAVVLIVLGPFINRNFGLGDSLIFVLRPGVWDSAPIAVLVSLTHLILLVACALLSVTLVTASLVIRSADASGEGAEAVEYAPK